MNNLKDMLLTGPTGDRIFGLARAAFYGWLTYEVGKLMGSFGNRGHKNAS